MIKDEDFIGMKFGKLLVIEKSKVHKKDGKYLWQCKCDCGKTAYYTKSSIDHGGVKSCGCLKKLELTGKKFGDLLVIKELKERGNHGEVFFECKCVCGKIKIVRSNKLVSGEVKNCGCKKENDLVGNRYGKLVVIKRTGLKKKYNTEKGQWLWECKCDCGQTTLKTKKSLEHYHSTSCGCDFKYNLIGREYGDLLVVEKAEERDIKGNILWKCKCKCGKSINVISRQLLHGIATSCGCQNARNLAGKRFGKLLVIRKTNKKNSIGPNKFEHLWECKCDCGSTVYKSRRYLEKYRVKSCGCDDKYNLIGKKFGMLEVLMETDERDGEHKLWECKCDCGKNTKVTTTKLLNGSAKHCGCLYASRDLTGKRFGRLLVIRKTNEKKFYGVSKHGCFLWECKCDCGKTVYSISSHLTKGCTTSCGCYASEISRKIGLETLAKYKQEKFVANTCLDVIYNEKPNKNNKSGYRGVMFEKQNNKYIAFITFQGRRYNLGRYDKILDAVEARRTSEDKLHGDFLEWFNEAYPEKKIEIRK